MASGLRTTLTDTTTDRRSVSDMISMIDPLELPLIAYLGLDGSSKIRLVSWPNFKYEHLEDSLAAKTTTCAEAIDTTETDIDVTDGTLFRVGDIILIDSEMMWVTSITSDTITVVREYHGDLATGDSHDNASTITWISSARLEGALSGDSPSTDVTSVTGYTQIFWKSVQVSRTQSKTSKYGIDDDYDYQVAKCLTNGGKAGELPRALEMAAFYGTAYAGTAANARTMAGLNTLITTNETAAASAALTRKMIEDSLQTAWTAGGSPTTIICNAWAKRKITSFYEGSARTDRETSMGGMVIDRIETEFGIVDILMDRYCPSSSLFIIDESKVGFLTFDDWFVEDLAKTGDSRKGQVVGEFGFFVANQTAHAKITGFSTTK